MDFLILICKYGRLLGPVLNPCDSVAGLCGQTWRKNSMSWISIQTLWEDEFRAGPPTVQELNWKKAQEGTKAETKCKLWI